MPQSSFSTNLLNINFIDVNWLATSDTSSYNVGIFHATNFPRLVIKEILSGKPSCENIELCKRYSICKGIVG